MMNPDLIILAVSGGVDSMAMLDIFKQQNILVAHFDHGTRPSSMKDAEFVKATCEEKNLPVVVATAQLGENVSEAAARAARYEFLFQLSSKHQNAEIYTAHHLDDLIESVAINLLRGTGWRGLAVLDMPGVRRPFLEPKCAPEVLQKLVPCDKKAIQKYAAKHKINYRQDPTNHEDNYLRNRLRSKLSDFPHKKEIFDLWQKQKELKRLIDGMIEELLPGDDEVWQRSWFENLDETIALELLRAGTLRAQISATRPQLRDFYQAILTYAPGKAFNLPGDKLVRFTKTSFKL